MDGLLHEVGHGRTVQLDLQKLQLRLQLPLDEEVHVEEVLAGTGTAGPPPGALLPHRGFRFRRRRRGRRPGHGRALRAEWGLVHRLLEVAHLQGELPDELVHADFEKLDGHVNVEQIPDLALSILGKYFKTHLASVCREDVAYCIDDSDPGKDEETASADSIEDIQRVWLARPQDKFEFHHLFEYLMLSVNRDERGRIVTGYIEVSLCPQFLLVPDGHPARKTKDYE